MTTPPRHDASRYSHYVGDALYSHLLETFSDWQDDARLVADREERDRFRALLEREARLLDQHRYETWLAMYVPECIYWVPSTPNGGDPRAEIAITFDDRRRLEDRIYRLRTGSAWSQSPQSRTVRLITNVEVFRAPDPEQRMIRSNFLISEFWSGDTRILSGWSGHHVIRSAAGWQIAAKQVNLIDCDQCIRNPSIIL